MPEQDLPSYSNMKDVAKNITSSKSSVSDLSVSEDEFIPDDTNHLTDMDSVSPSIFSRFETWLRGPDGRGTKRKCIPRTLASKSTRVGERNLGKTQQVAGQQHLEKLLCQLFKSVITKSGKIWRL